MTATQRATAVLLDIDGTLVHAGKQIPGAAETLAWLRANGVRIRLVTNTSAKSPIEISTSLVRLGIPNDVQEIFTPLVACEKYLGSLPNAKPKYFTSESVAKHLAQSFPESGDPNVLVLGDCGDGFNYALLNEVFNRWKDGAELVALQRNPFWWDAQGRRLLDCGAFLAALEFATQKTARVLGKPSAAFVRLILEDLGVGAQEALVVGDDVRTDITMGTEFGIPSVLVGTGKCTAQDVTHCQSLGVATVRTIVELPELCARTQAPSA